MSTIAEGISTVLKGYLLSATSSLHHSFDLYPPGYVSILHRDALLFNLLLFDILGDLFSILRSRTRVRRRRCHIAATMAGMHLCEHRHLPSVQKPCEQQDCEARETYPRDHDTGVAAQVAAGVEEYRADSFRPRIQEQHNIVVVSSQVLLCAYAKLIK